MTLIEELEKELAGAKRKARFYGTPYFDGVLRGVATVINIVKSHADWISVDERLPETRQRILMCFKEKGIVSGTWFGGKNGYFESDNEMSDTYSLSENTMDFWQPLPNPPSKIQKPVSKLINEWTE